VLLKSRQATAKGATFITRSTTLAEAAYTASSTRTSGAAVSGGSSVTATPNTSATNMSWSMFGNSTALAGLPAVTPVSESMGLAGTSVFTTCMSGDSGAAFFSLSAAATRFSASAP
jgi:hypothetical protein